MTNHLNNATPELLAHLKALTKALDYYVKRERTLAAQRGVLAFFVPGDQSLSAARALIRQIARRR